MNPLTIYPKHPSAPDTYYIGGGWSPACITAVDKRFTDAELAAEYWAQQMEAVRAFDRAYPSGESEELDIEEARIQVLYRFCTQPAHDENPA